MKKSKKLKMEPLNLISLDEARNRIQRWREYVGEVFKTKAFFIGLVDLKNLCIEVEQMEGKGVRCYLAKRENGEDCIILVGVENEVDNPNGKDIYKKTGLDSKIYDFSSPCPNMCDITSELNTLPSDKLKKPLKDLVIKKNKATIKTKQSKTKLKK